MSDDLMGALATKLRSLRAERAATECIRKYGEHCPRCTGDHGACCTCGTRDESQPSEPES